MSRILTERAHRRARPRRVATAAAGSLLLLVVTGCSQETTDQWKRLGLPEGATDRTPYIYDLWIGAWVAALIIGAFTWGLIGWATVRYRRRDNDDLPAQVRYNAPIEMLYTVAPVIVVAVLFFFTVQTQDRVIDEAENPDHTVQVTAQQWSWTFSYLGESAVGEDVYEVGTPAIEPEVWLVKDETVTFNLHSPDVVHSFWVPSFYYKLDVIPGRDQSFSITPTKAGTFQGRCAELCGYLHSRMLFKIVVVDTQQELDEHLLELQEAGQVGSPRGGEGSEVVEGLDEASEEASE
ncbi:MAG: cytochrome c oxidase subunit II [Actinomycetota bacterium]|nr:cytochrome c oxidase subunit II [Actinomycetota bacterium]